MMEIQKINDFFKTMALLIIAFTILGMSLYWRFEGTEEIITKSGVRCIKSPFTVTCNWDEWNMKTDYGSFKVATEPIHGDTTIDPKLSLGDSVNGY
jgi:hypothetical protein